LRGSGGGNQNEKKANEAATKGLTQLLHGYDYINAWGLKGKIAPQFTINALIEVENP
jgi:hypothetical protein